MTDERIGQCGNCGGDVVVPRMVMTGAVPRGRCVSCGSYARAAGPVIVMEPLPRGVVTWDRSGGVTSVGCRQCGRVAPDTCGAVECRR